MFHRSIIFFLVLGFLGLEVLGQSPQSGADFEEAFGFPWAQGARPYIEGSFGLGFPRHKKFEGDFSRLGTGELRLGYSNIKPYKDKKATLDLDELYVFGGYFTQDLDIFESEASSDETLLKITRFGVGNRLGFGYKIWFLGILPFNEVAFNFTRIDSERLENISDNDRDILDRYEGSYRFGVSTTGGVNFQLFKSLSAVVSYDASVIYPRVVFFPWLGSVIVQTFIVGGVSRFAQDIVDRSPLLGPIMYAVLRNAAAYGVYLGMRQYQYWPFKSETPLTHESLKIGFSITF